MDQLALIRKPIEEDLTSYLSLFEKDFSHANPLLNLALQHILKRQGKRLRPILSLLSAKCFDRVDEKVLHASVSLELLHTASLVHDDIVDESDQRRGQKSVNVLLTPQAAVLIGDYLLSKALQHSAMTDNVEVVKQISFIGEQLSDGELLQLYALDSEEISEEVYYNIIKRKTASLFSTSAQLGAMLAGASEEQINAMRLFGEYLGIAFQIRDDILDYVGDTSLGKPRGNDMKEGKLTLPAIYAVNKSRCLSNFDGSDTAGSSKLSDDSTDSSADNCIYQLALKVRRTKATDEEIAKLVSFTVEQGGLDYAREMMEKYVEMAKAQLNVLPQSDCIDSLVAFANLVIKRKV